MGIDKGTYWLFKTKHPLSHNHIAKVCDIQKDVVTYDTLHYQGQLRTNENIERNVFQQLYLPMTKQEIIKWHLKYGQ